MAGEPYPRPPDGWTPRDEWDAQRAARVRDLIAGGSLRDAWLLVHDLYCAPLRDTLRVELRAAEAAQQAAQQAALAALAMPAMPPVPPAPHRTTVDLDPNTF